MASSNSSLSLYGKCQQFVPSMVIYSTYTLFNLLVLLPLYVLVVTISLGRWRGGRFAMSHTDIFTFHMMFLEFFGVIGSVFYILSLFTGGDLLMLMGVYVFCVIYPGQTLFHVVTCLERYMAVVHPVTYMRLRDAQGVRIRNVCVLTIWLLCMAWICVTYRYYPTVPGIPTICYLGVCILLMLFFCLSVLFVLIRPGPGEVGGAKGQSNQLKRRVFHMIVAIMAALALRCVGLLQTFVVESMLKVNKEMCALLDGGLFLTVPSSLVLPLLFLHKTGKLTCRRRSQSRDTGRNLENER